MKVNILTTVFGLNVNEIVGSTLLYEGKIFLNNSMHSYHIRDCI